jgi:chromosome segregation ATPase
MLNEPCANMECISRDELKALRKAAAERDQWRAAECRAEDGCNELMELLHKAETERDELKAELEQVRPELDRVIDLGDRLEVAEQTITHLKAVIEDACNVVYLKDGGQRG